MESDELISLLELRLDRMLSPLRAGHSRGVAALAAELCEKQGIDPRRGRIAGLAHDLCKELPKREQRELAAHYNGAPSSSLLGDKIIHGPAAAGLLARDYGVADAELLEAVALHTVGRPGMGPLAAIVYCADKLESGRDHVDPSWRKRVLGLAPLDMLRETVADVIGWLEDQGRPVAPESLVLYNSLRTRTASE
jgi:predicted HD superfamily hydrolase involved in NAD metabolism